MLNNNELVEKISKDINKLQDKIENRKLYNIRNLVVKSLIKSGIAIDYALPFILAALIIANSQASKGDAPFHIDEITEKAGIESIDTSNGIHLEHISYDFDYNQKFIEHSTGWVMNNHGLYERTVTSYRLSDEIDLEETDKILAMTKEEIEQILVITNIQTIKKNTLSPEDSIYNSDAIIIINHSESEEEARTRLETSSENVWHSIGFIILALCWGNNVRNLEKLFVKTYIRDKLREYEPLFRPINKEELETMKKVLELKKKNMALLNSESETSNFENNQVYSRKLRRI